MDLVKLKKHVELCKRNLSNWRVKCCAECPFEREITKHYPEFAVLFVKKRKDIGL